MVAIPWTSEEYREEITEANRNIVLDANLSGLARSRAGATWAQCTPKEKVKAEKVNDIRGRAGYVVSLAIRPDFAQKPVQRVQKLQPQRKAKGNVKDSKAIAALAANSDTRLATARVEKVKERVSPPGAKADGTVEQEEYKRWAGKVLGKTTGRGKRRRQIRM